MRRYIDEVPTFEDYTYHSRVPAGTKTYELVMTLDPPEPGVLAGAIWVGADETETVWCYDAIAAVSPFQFDAGPAASQAEARERAVAVVRTAYAEAHRYG